MSEQKILKAEIEEYFDEHYTCTSQLRLQCFLENGHTEPLIIIDSDFPILAKYIENALNDLGKAVAIDKLKGK